MTDVGHGADAGPQSAKDIVSGAAAATGPTWLHGAAALGGHVEGKIGPGAVGGGDGGVWRLLAELYAAPTAPAVCDAHVRV